MEGIPTKETSNTPNRLQNSQKRLQMPKRDFKYPKETSNTQKRLQIPTRYFDCPFAWGEYIQAWAT